MGYKEDRKKMWEESSRIGPKMVDYFARFCLVFVNTAPLILNIVVVIQLMRANARAFTDEINEYVGNAFRLYGGDERDGYVDNSTIPKQSGGYVWTLFFHVALIILILGGIAAELVVFKSCRKWSFKVLGYLQLAGLVSGDRNDVMPRPGMYLFALFLYKMFLVSLLFSQSFQSLEQFNSNDLPDGFSWRLFAIWTTYATMASALPSILSRVFAWITEKDQSKRDGVW